MRIVTQEELDAAKIESWLVIAFDQTVDCFPCLEYLRSTGHTQQCRQAYGDDWAWHGVEGEAPTPENIYRYTNERMVVKGTCSEGHRWGDCPSSLTYIDAVHARAVTLARAVTGDFDEEAERARLQAVPA